MKKLVAQQRMKEFDLECELHHPLLIVKAVDPGCTTELQIENCVTGKIVRLTTTDESVADMNKFIDAVCDEFRKAWLQS